MRHKITAEYLRIPGYRRYFFVTCRFRNITGRNVIRPRRSHIIIVFVLRLGAAKLLPRRISVIYGILYIGPLIPRQKRPRETPIPVYCYSVPVDFSSSVCPRNHNNTVCTTRLYRRYSCPLHLTARSTILKLFVVIPHFFLKKKKKYII